MQRELRLLEAFDEDHAITQRALATKLGIALGLANLYVRRLVRQGCVQCVSIPRNRIRYHVTEKGIARKAWLTGWLMEHSLRVYRQARRHLKMVLGRLIRDGHRIAIFGSDDRAELVCLSLRDLGVEPVAIFNLQGGGDVMGMRVRPMCEHVSVQYDLLLVASFGAETFLMAQLARAGVSESKLASLEPRRGSSPVTVATPPAPCRPDARRAARPSLGAVREPATDVDA